MIPALKIEVFCGAVHISSIIGRPFVCIELGSHNTLDGRKLNNIPMALLFEISTYLLSN